MPLSKLSAAALAAGAAKGNFGAGAVLQVVQVVKTDTWVNTVSDSYLEISGLIASITPSSVSSKILVNVSLGAVSSYSAAIRLLKNGSPMTGALGQAAGSRVGQTARATYLDANHPNMINFMYLDSPATLSALTYSIGASGYNGYGFYLNRSVNDTDTSNTYGGRTISTITLMEIAG